MAKRSKTKTQNLTGKEAYLKGLTVEACPYEEGTDEFETWNADWDAAADEAEAANTTQDEQQEEEKQIEQEEHEKEEKSVVKETYRARYAEAGHPTHCGDELAILLNNLCLTKAGIELPRFEHIMEANGVDLSKYNRTTKGWQGRLRMTGRNILAAKAFEAGGVVKTTIEKRDETGALEDRTFLEGAEPEYRLSADWMLKQRKGKAA